MKIFHLKRKTEYQKYYSTAMGSLNSRVVYIKKCFLGIPFKTIHKYKEIYYGEIRKRDDCHLFI